MNSTPLMPCLHPWAKLIQLRDELVCMDCGDMLNGRETVLSQMRELARLGDKLSDALNDLIHGDAELDSHMQPYVDAMEAYRFFRLTIMGAAIEPTPSEVIP